MRTVAALVVGLVVGAGVTYYLIISGVSALNQNGRASDLGREVTLLHYLQNDNVSFVIENLQLSISCRYQSLELERGSFFWIDDSFTEKALARAAEVAGKCGNEIEQ